MAVQEYFLRFGSGNPANLSGLAPTFILFRNFSGSNIASPSITEVGSTSGIYKFTYNATQSICFTADGNTSSLSSSDRYVSGSLGVDDSLTSDVQVLGQSLINLGITFSAFNSSFVSFDGNFNSFNSTFTGFNQTFTAFNSTFSGFNQTFTAFSATFNAFNSSFVAVGNTVLSNGAISSSLTTQVTNLGQTQVAIGNTLLSLGFSNTFYSSLSGLYSLIGDTASSYGDETVDPTTVFGFLKRSQELFEGQQEFQKTTGSLTFFDRNASYTLRGFTISDSQTTTERV